MKTEAQSRNHRVLLDLAQHFGYIVITPEELRDMVEIAAANCPTRVAQVEEAIEVLKGVLKRIDVLDPPLKDVLMLPIQYLLRDVEKEVKLRA